MIATFISALIGALVALMFSELIKIIQMNKKKNAIVFFLNNTIQETILTILDEIDLAEKTIAQFEKKIYSFKRYPNFNGEIIKEFKYHELYNIYGKRVENVYNIAGYLNFINDNMFPNDIVKKCKEKSSELMKYYDDYKNEPSDTITVKMTPEQYRSSEDFLIPTSILAQKRLDSLKETLTKIENEIMTLNS